ncbi:hypothetical protein ACS5UA_22370 [Brucella sp. RRSP16]|uniref:hypothetical protein n=1 Tax=Brucella sp. RRSP16 TaxID=3453707 RepID=UPI003FCDE417
MRKFFLTALASLVGATASHAAPPQTTETIILVRHGEKPEGGLGQLSCRGLNRSLKLPAVIARDFGKPDAIFAPNPAKEKMDGGVSYAYIRPLATVEPTAIRFEMPVDTRFGYDEIEKLQAALEQPQYASATILIGWEHKQLYKLARNLLQENGGDKAAVPKWRGDDFNSIYVLHIQRSEGHSSARFERLNEGLDGQPAGCPG